MALIKVDFLSKYLMRTVSFQAIIPVDNFDETTYNQEVKPFKTLYLLHGIFGNDTDWVSGTRIQAWANDYNLAVIMPAGENKFYLDNNYSGESWSKFIGEELVTFTRKLFPLSNKREDTFIVGLSMGGYGALINGLKYHETFGYIAALSPALMLDDYLNGTLEIPLIPKESHYFEFIFGKAEDIKGSDKDYKHLIKTLVSQNVTLPELYICIGKDDSLLKNVDDFDEYLNQLQVKHTYVIDGGGHEWYFWDKYIHKILDWLPLTSTNMGINSGNVTK